MRIVLSRLYIQSGKKLKIALVLLACFAMSFSKHCKAEESLFMDGDPRYPLVSAEELHRQYLDLDACEIISDDEDGFEIYAEYFDLFLDPISIKGKHIYRFRKNDESDGELQFWDDSRKKWLPLPDPSDQEAINQALYETGQINFRLETYAMFKCAYKYLFNETYEDSTDDDALQRSVMILPREEKPRPHAYLWYDKNYPRVWRSSYYSVHLDKNSVYVEAEASPQCILQVLTLDTVLLHYNDIFPNAIYFDRFLYDEDEGKMYWWSPSKEEWDYLRPNSPGRNVCIGEAAFYLAYGKKFYGETAEWSRRRTPYHWNENDTTFYERLEGMEEEDEIALRNQRILSSN